MKSHLVLIVLIIFTLKGFSQDTISLTSKKNKGHDFFMVDLFTDIWQDVPDEADNRVINQGVNVYFMLNLPIGKTNFSLNSGIGVGSHNFYSDADPEINQLTGRTDFIKLKNKYKEDIDYNVNKINITSIDIPFEIKFKTRADRNKRFKASIGCKLGYNFSNHTKYRGEDVIEGTKDVITLKKSNIKYLNTLNYGITARIGYGMYNLMAYYSFSKLFEKDKEPQMYPISIGISITPF